MDADAVARAIVQAEEREIAPRFRMLRTDEVVEKSPGEVVTAADRSCEVMLGGLLRDVCDVPVVGEEAAAADPEIVQLIESSPAVWVLDPLDGTSNFANGSTDYAVMVAFVEKGNVTASWMWHPHRQTMAVAQSGSGAFVNGVKCEAVPPTMSQSCAGLKGVVKERFLPEAVKNSVRASASQFAGFSEGRNCAGLDYPDLVSGVVDFLFYWRTLPWDHAPGALFAREAGCVVLRPDATEYRCGAASEGLVVAHRDICDLVRRTLLSPP